MSSMMIGSNSHEKGSISGPGPSSTTAKHGKASARSVEKQGPTFQRLNPHASHSLNQTTQHAVQTMQTQISATKQSIAASTSYDNHPNSSQTSSNQTKTMKVSKIQIQLFSQFFGAFLPKCSQQIYTYCKQTKQFPIINSLTQSLKASLTRHVSSKLPSC